MTDKELRRLSRRGLLKLLRDQELEIAALEEERDRWKAEALDRRLAEKDSGSLAEAALCVTRLFEKSREAFDRILDAAQEAADVYMGNVQRDVPGGMGHPQAAPQDQPGPEAATEADAADVLMDAGCAELSQGDAQEPAGEILEGLGEDLPEPEPLPDVMETDPDPFLPPPLVYGDPVDDGEEGGEDDEDGGLATSIVEMLEN